MSVKLTTEVKLLRWDNKEGCRFISCAAQNSFIYDIRKRETAHLKHFYVLVWFLHTGICKLEIKKIFTRAKLDTFWPTQDKNILL